MSFICSILFMLVKIIFSRNAKDRFTSEEKKAIEQMQQDIYKDIRQAAEAHRQVCSFNVVLVDEIGVTIAILKCIFNNI